MAKLSNLTSGKWIQPGERVHEVVSAAEDGGNAAQLVREIAKVFDGSRIRRHFPSEWAHEDGVMVNRGMVSFNETAYSITLKIGANEGLVIKDVPGKAQSLKLRDDVLAIGESFPLHRLPSYACQVVGCWLVHGKNWFDRVGRKFRQPYGSDRSDWPEKFCFEIIDGAKGANVTFAELLEKQCVRSTHVGQWHQRHSTIIPAACDMKLTLHEFKAEGGDDICKFRDLVIGLDSHLWGPYCRWNENVRRSGDLGMWNDLAQKANSPFTFHVHATRTLFPGAQLDSDFLLESVGRERLMAILDAMAEHEPDRFYRLIDEQGKTHRIARVEDDRLYYGTHGSFPRKFIAQNVFTTFEHMQMLQHDVAYRLPRVPRVVIDTHAYHVIEALAARRSSVHMLSGRDMHRYMTSQVGGSYMHKLRDERLFLLLRKFFGIEAVKLYIYPPLSWNSGLVSQYDTNLAKFNKEDFLYRTLAS